MRLRFNAKTQRGKGAQDSPHPLASLRLFAFALTAFYLASCSATRAVEPLPTPLVVPTAAPVGEPTPAPTATTQPSETPISPPTATGVFATPSFVTAEANGDATPPSSASEDGFASLDHFYFVGRPVPPHAEQSVAASYRYGSTYDGRYDTHHGDEFQNPAGTQLLAVAPGAIYWADDDLTAEFGAFPNFYGLLAVLELDQKWRGHTVYALYGHLLALAVEPGQHVETGDLIGYVGASGIARGPHLHLEVRLDNPRDYYATRNPELWLAPLPGTGVIAGQVLDSRGEPIPDARVDIECTDGKYRYADTYHDDTVNPDEVYRENFVVGDVPAGTCELSVSFRTGTVKPTITVEEGKTTFVVLKPPED